MDEQLKHLTDHEAILLISQDVRNLKKSQEDFHTEMRGAMTELKNNYQGTLNNHETRLTNLEATRVDFKEKMGTNGLYIKWVLAAVALTISILFWHLTGYKI